MTKARPLLNLHSVDPMKTPIKHELDKLLVVVHIEGSIEDTNHLWIIVMTILEQ